MFQVQFQYRIFEHIVRPFCCPQEIATFCLHPPKFERSSTETQIFDHFNFERDSYKLFLQNWWWGHVILYLPLYFIFLLTLVPHPLSLAQKIVRLVILAGPIHVKQMFWSRYLHFQSQKWKHENIAWNLFKVNNKDTKKS